MQASAAPFGRTKWLLARNRLLWIALYRNAILFLGLFGIGLLYVAGAKFAIGPFANIVIPSVLVVFGSMLLVGKRVFTVTSFDYYFVGFILFACVSHIFANEFLFRMLSMAQLQANLSYILTVAILFRAFFCLIYISPKLGSRMFVGASVAVLTIVSVLGILQRFGPGKAQATHVGAALSLNSLQVVQAAQTGRPTGVYSNPNILGYASCVFAAFIFGWGLRDVRWIKPWKTAAVCALLGLSFLCVIACQSRQSLGALVFAPLIFAVVVRLQSVDWRNTLVLGLLIGIAGFGLTMAVSASKSTYLTSISKTGVKKDQSYQARAEELKKLQAISGEIAAGGSGQSMSNVSQALVYTEHSRYNTEEIDSEWGNMFQAFGIWGPLLLALFYTVTARDIRQVWRLQDPDARMVALVSLALLLFNLVLTLTAVRVSKYESSGFTFEVLGALSAWRIIGLERRPPDRLDPALSSHG